MAQAQGAGDDSVTVGNWLQSRNVLDLEDLCFAQGSHLMSNKVAFSLLRDTFAIACDFKKNSAKELFEFFPD